jgi:PAS domain S-box-containing protein
LTLLLARAPKLLRIDRCLQFPRLRPSAVAFAVSVCLVCVVLAVDINRPALAPRLVPILVVALSLALVFSVLSLWRVRSEHLGTDQAFRNTDCEFSSIFQNALDGILILDNEGSCLDVNPSGAAILRIARNDVVGKNIYMFFPDSDVFGQRWTEFLRTTSCSGRIKLAAGDGTTVIVDFSGVANYLPGRHIFILCDVTEQTRAEDALRESEERFRYVADNIREIIWRMNAETKQVVYVNQAYTAVTGHPIESLYQDPSSYEELIHPQDRIRVFSRLKEAVVSGTFDEEFQFVHANGTIRWIWVQGSLAPESGSAHWLVGTAMDITARKQAEQQISEHLDTAEAARAEAEALRKATLALSQNLSMDSVLDTLLQCIGELVPFDRAGVLFVDDPEHMFVAREAPRTQPRNAICVLSARNHQILQRILFEQKPVLLSDTEREPQWRDSPPFERTRCWLGIPLVAASRVIGVLSLSNRTRGSFTPEHLRIAKNLAISAAVAIENARTHERAAIYASELELRLQDLHEAKEALAKANRQSSLDSGT